MSKAYLEPEEIIKLEQAAEYLRDKLLITLLFHLGCRVSEALGLRIKDIDFKQGTVTIEHLKTRISLPARIARLRLGKAINIVRFAVLRSNRRFLRRKSAIAIGSCRWIKKP